MFCSGAFTLIVCFFQFEVVADLLRVGLIWVHTGKMEANYIPPFIFFNDTANHVTVFTTVIGHELYGYVKKMLLIKRNEYIFFAK